MAIYLFKAVNENGKTISGEIEADSSQAALELLSRQGHIPESVKEKISRASAFQFLERKVQAKDLILYTKQFKTLLKAGVSILMIFQILEAQTENKSLKKVTAKMKEDVKQGSSLFKGFSAHKSAFSRLYCSMIKAGEESGSLPRILERLIYIIEHEEKVRNDIKSAARYPLIVLTFLAVAFMILLTFVVPKFVSIFEKAGIELPVPTQICMMMYEFLNHYWLYMCIILIIFIVGLVWFVKTDLGRLLKDIGLMRIPIIGPLFVKSSMSRFSSIFSILQSSGITVLESMQILTDTINNAAISREFEKIRGLLEEGRGISRPLGQARYFTPMVINMVAVGEESGNLDEMLQEIAVHYDAEVEYATKGMSEAIGPILMIGLAAVVGFFALAIFLPMWDLTQMVQ
ncbi:type II secretion system F family protein [Desulfobacula phenolica]|uniref:Type IV pilus assembly protein PilC n=1 Tax=Desulfobacula phenolica TaxID=90732 RepID=A0A1H2FSV9_9BACT|nr:type II secretion system F family protein [Desulfobacula phenolica]SDU10443.1 type IV pilus assembly protein PilC [Desulfobacula phenolica]